MTAENFPAALHFTLGEEGGNDDDPRDHGGRTSRGITQREWDAYRAAHVDLPVDVWLASQGDIERIYHDQYWEPYCDQLPGGLDLVFFDFAVNAGRQQAVKCLQRALAVPADGMLGMITLQAIGTADIGVLVHAYSDQRRAFYHALKQFPIYGKGWTGRANRCELAAAPLAQATPHPAVADALKPEGSAKVNPTEIKEPTVSPQKGGVIGAGSTGLSGLLQQIQSDLSPYAYYIKAIQYVLIGVALIGFAAMLYGFWHQNKMKEIAG